MNQNEQIIDPEYKKEIESFLGNPPEWFQKIVNEKDFYFQNGQDVLKEWISFDLKIDEISNLFELSKDYKNFLSRAESDQLVHQALTKINKVIAYCDFNARDKHILNEYEDKRILAKASVRQGNWVNLMIKFKLKQTRNQNNSVYNALNFLLNPQTECTILSENHRKMICENIWGIEYNAETFVESLKSYFSVFNIKVRNLNNYTYALSCLVYEFKNAWLDYIVGLMASDTTGWQENHIKQSKDKYSIIWNSKKPTGTDQTLKALRIILEEDGQFYLYYSMSNNVEYRATVIDFAEDQNDLTQKNWPEKYGGIEFYQSNFSDYVDGNKKANIVFLVENLDKIDSKPISEFRFYKSQPPRQDNLSPISVDPIDNEISANELERISHIMKIRNIKSNIPLNQILYGPPGTGKTYTTINKSIEIADSGFEFEDKKRFEIVQRFHELKEEGKIEFITFHQSFSYEDFIEGIKPVMLDNDEEKSEVKYEIRPGVFKRICDKARGIGDFEIRNEENVDFQHSSYYKMSLGGKNKLHIHDWCINNNKLALGWGGEADLSHLKQYTNNWNQFKSEFQKQFPAMVEESRYHIQSSFIFLKMKKGDVVLVSKGNKIIDAIGVISDNEYNYDPNQEFDYCHYRNVKWLATDLNASPELFVRKNISQQTIYEFYDADVKKEYFNLKFNKNEEPEGPDNYVLVIDEINRGNIAAIFGELITLIESDKRLGEENELTATLPYSGKEEKPFGVPPNLYIIGTMNTADRSVEALDAALRRRFSFEEMPPRYDLEGLDYEIEGFKAGNILKTINRRIEKILDKDHLIGHSYFIKQHEEDAKTVLEKALFEKIIPLLQEYFYGDIGKINLILGNGFIEVEKDADNIFPKSNYENNDYFERKIFKLIPKEKVNLKEALQLMEIKRD